MDKLFFWRAKKPEMPFENKPLNLGGLGKEHELALGEEPETGPATGLAPPGIPASNTQHTSPYPNAPNMPETPVPAEQMSSYPSQAAAPSSSSERDIQLLNAKLDSLKAILDSINQRLANIERIANESQESEKHEIY